MKKVKTPFTFKNTNKECMAFLDYALDFAERCDKKIEFRNVKYLLINRKEACTGYADEEGLVVAYQSDENSIWKAFETFIHEFCHLEQEAEDSDEWKNWRWFDFSNKFDPFAYENVMSVIALERDCEKRAIKYINKYQMFDSAPYAKEANAYLYFQQFCFLKGKWFSLKQNQKLYEEFVDIMPEKLIPLKNFWNIDMQVMQKFEIIFDK
jgi:hypothetical protein